MPATFDDMEETSGSIKNDVGRGRKMSKRVADAFKLNVAPCRRAISPMLHVHLQDPLLPALPQFQNIETNLPRTNLDTGRALATRKSTRCVRQPIAPLLHALAVKRTTFPFRIPLQDAESPPDSGARLAIVPACNLQDRNYP